MADGTETPGVQAMLGAAGACPVVRCNGKAYKLGHPTQAAKARLEELASDAAVLRVEAKRGRVPADALKAMLDRVADRITANEFVTWREGWQETVWADGGALFALSLFQEHHPDMTVAECRALIESAPAQYKAALARVLPGFFDLLLAGQDLPPAQESQVRAGLADLLQKLTPPPEPTPETTAT